MSHTSDIAAAVDHRPWPLPGGPWVLYQSWRNLLFAHWRVVPAELRPLVPPELEIDLHDGDAWVSISPFAIEEFRPRGVPALPRLSSFPELNLRTYVRTRGKPGIYFFSLDAGSRVAVAGARTLFRLPYHHADMRIEDAGPRIEFRSERPGRKAAFAASYAPADHAVEAAAGTLDHFLTERYVLFSVLRDGRILEAEIHHRPWPLQPAEAEIRINDLAAAEGVSLPDDAPLLHFSRRQDTLIWAPSVLEPRR